VGRPIWNVPYPRNPFFTGRDEVVKAIRTRLTQRRRAALAQAISGLGGIGKTQTAVEYAHRYRDKYQAILWLNAESPLTLKADCGELARLMQLPHPENDLDQAVVALKQWLATQIGWLLVFDNADDAAMLKPFLLGTAKGHILLTSRAQDFQDLEILNPVELEELPVEDATAFLLKRCGREAAEADERDAARELASELGRFPLALEQAAAYMAETKATFPRYLESYRTRGLKLIEARLPALGRYAKSVANTWAANFEAVEAASPAAADVLRFSAFLAPDAIPFELLAQGASELGPPVGDALAKANGDPLLVDDLLRPLVRFSLIRVDGHHATFGTHRMVQKVLESAMDDATRHLWAERAVRAVKRAWPPVVHRDWARCVRLLLPHALAVFSWIERDRLVFAEAGQLLNLTALDLYHLGRYADAEPLLVRAMEICREALGERHPNYAGSLNNLAMSYKAMGRHADAEPLLVRAMEIYREALGEGHPEYDASLNNLVRLYRAMGRHADAEPLLVRAMEIYREALGEGHPDYAASLNNLAGLYRAMGRHADAEPLLVRAMEIYREVLGERHPDYDASLKHLAVLYHEMGRHADARSLRGADAEPILVLREVLGEGHPDFAGSLIQYHEMGRHADARPLRGMATIRDKLGHWLHMVFKSLAGLSSPSR
jgi:tetratricopeptide (TPR) repeat protein